MASAKYLQYLSDRASEAVHEHGGKAANLLCNIMHYCRIRGDDFSIALELAREVYKRQLSEAAKEAQQEVLLLPLAPLPY